MINPLEVVTLISNLSASVYSAPATATQHSVALF